MTTLVGLFKITVPIFGLIKTMWRYKVWKPSLNLKTRYPGRWAVVTGASDGIGLGFCKVLARQGYDVCLVSRNQQKLEDAASIVREENPNIQTKIVTCDLTSLTCYKDYEQKLYPELDELDVAILINNAGVSQQGRISW